MVYKELTNRLVGLVTELLSYQFVLPFELPGFGMAHVDACEEIGVCWLDWGGVLLLIKSALSSATLVQLYPLAGLTSAFMLTLYFDIYGSSLPSSQEQIQLIPAIKTSQFLSQLHLHPGTIASCSSRLPYYSHDLLLVLLRFSAKVPIVRTSFCSVRFSVSSEVRGKNSPSRRSWHRVSFLGVCSPI